MPSCTCSPLLLPILAEIPALLVLIVMIILYIRYYTNSLSDQLLTYDF